MKAVDRKMDDEVFKREEFERFNHVFHIGPKSPGGASSSSSSEQKTDDLNASKVGTNQWHCENLFKSRVNGTLFFSSDDNASKFRLSSSKDKSTILCDLKKKI